MSIVEEIRAKYRVLREINGWQFGYCDIACADILKYYPHLIPVKMYLKNSKDERLWHMILYDPITQNIIDPTSDQFGIEKWLFRSIEEWVDEYKRRGWIPYCAQIVIKKKH